jgi:hypothetical protein
MIERGADPAMNLESSRRVEDGGFLDDGIGLELDVASILGLMSSECFEDFVG